MHSFLLLISFGLFTAFVAGASIICFFTFMTIYKGGPYYSEKNKKGLPKYKRRKDTYNLDPELSHGHNEPHV